MCSDICACIILRLEMLIIRKDKLIGARPVPVRLGVGRAVERDHVPNFVAPE